MTILLIFLLLSVPAIATPAAATNITVPVTASDDDRLRELRLLAGTGASSDGRGSKELLKKLGDSVVIAELPDILRQLKTEQEGSFRDLQEQFRRLTSRDGVSESERQALVREIERHTSSLQGDQQILAALRGKLDAALAGSTDPAERSVLEGYQKMLADSAAALRSYQNESAKMLRTEFRTISAGPDQEVKTIHENYAAVSSEVDGLAKAAGSNPSGLSQDWFREGQDKLSGSLAQIDELTQRLQSLLEKTPGDAEAQATLRALQSRRSQIAQLLRDFSVKEVRPQDLTALQNLGDILKDSVKRLKEQAEAIKKHGTPEDLERLFAEYDRLVARSEEAKKLYEQSLPRAGQKYKTAEQAEMEANWLSLSGALSGLGLLAGDFDPGSRDAAWEAYFREKEAESAVQDNPRQFELINDITSATLKPRTPLTSQLDGLRLGDVLVKGGSSYGVAVRDAGATSLTMANDQASLKRVELVAFRLRDGYYTSVTLGVYDIYNGAVHAAVNIDAAGDLVVFLNHTETGNKDMTGALYKLDKDTLAQKSLSELDFSAPDKGWYPRINADGTVEHMSVIGGGEYACSGANDCVMSALLPLEFQAQTDAIKAWQSGNILDTAAWPEDLPAAVVARRLNGDTAAEQLGEYSYLAWGRWNDGVGSADSIFVNSPWIAGSLTPVAAIPAAGSAFYSGEVLGKINEAGIISAIGGTTALTADFAARTLTGNFNMTKDGAAWQGAAVNASWAAAQNGISGRLITDDSQMSGALKGGFFGPAADQVGGSWNLQNADASSRAAGVFTGDKQGIPE